MDIHRHGALQFRSEGFFSRLCLRSALLFLIAHFHVLGQESRFYRVAGPVPATITHLDSQGYVTWTNAFTNATFIVQTSSTLPSTNDWCDWVRVSVTNDMTTLRIFDPAPKRDFVFIPAGVFTMGDPFQEEPAAVQLHEVNVDAIYIGKYEIAKAEWDQVFTWATNNGYSFENAGSKIVTTSYSKGQSHPVHIVNWYDVVKWCNAKSEKEGLAPAYYTNAALTVVYRGGRVVPYASWNAGYRLPTEAEWEKAARGGMQNHRFPWLDSNLISHQHANYCATNNLGFDTSAIDLSYPAGYHPAYATNGTPFTSPVGNFAPNNYGLFDMAGNVWEWCWDWYGGYTTNAQENPHGPNTGTFRVYRGGGWEYGPSGCFVARRLAQTPNGQSTSLGFRIVLPMNP